MCLDKHIRQQFINTGFSGGVHGDSLKADLQGDSRWKGPVPGWVWGVLRGEGAQGHGWGGRVWEATVWACVGC